MITIVSPWYGPDTAGGAETQARSLARALHAQGVPLRIWTSTGRDSFHPTATAHYPPGHSTLDGIPIWRFRPDQPDERGVPRFFQRHRQFLPPLERFAPHELRLLGTLLSSDELYAAILAERAQSRFIFLPYPFPTTFWGALLAGKQGFLLPCLHDEPYARYSTYRYLFEQVQGVLANSPAEAALAQQLYNLPVERICMAGEGIDLRPRGNGAALRQRYGLEDCRVLLYAGRREPSKNTPLLLAYVREYWARRGGQLRLLLLGKGDVAVPRALQPLVLDLGYTDEQTKHDAYAAADLFVQPSTMESFSIVLMEAWLQGTPALVHADCAVTADHVQRSAAGLTFADFGTFAAALDLLLPDSQLRHTLGERGRAFVLATCRWDEVARRTANFVLHGQ